MILFDLLAAQQVVRPFAPFARLDVPIAPIAPPRASLSRGAFMHWHGAPCLVDRYMPDHSAWVIDDGCWGYVVVASPQCWGALAAHHMADAYRPEGV